MRSAPWPWDANRDLIRRCNDPWKRLVTFMKSKSQTPSGYVTRESADAGREFEIHVQGRRVPIAVWFPEGEPALRPLILVGHGGSGHKTSNLVLSLMRPLRERNFVVAAIDGPVHGARRMPADDPSDVRTDFRRLWERGGSVDPMVEDWRATLDELSTLPQVDAANVGWFGISMGTAYGLPFIAKEPRIRAAVLGMWGTCRARSARLVEDGPAVVCPVLFQQKAQDEIFTPQGQADVFDNLGSDRKMLRVYAGGHTDPIPEQVDDAVRFLSEHLRGAG